MLQKNKRSEGFTLVELLVVIAIIGLLSTLSIVALNNARQKSRDAVRAADIKQMMTALELYYSDTGAYPTTVAIGGKIASGTATYMGIVPSSPKPWIDGKCSGTDAADFAYTRDSLTSYSIKYCLAGNTGGIVAGGHIATPNGTADGVWP
ncbi:MAG: prepilin-type N-terminal cleavage/methylation domain-containing protein [Patescibacteria group bacterium]|nr:prepilin-type N-terminal cleavage/methylation domain-containing protein [Patescibacteria group bacterium]